MSPQHHRMNIWQRMHIDLPLLLGLLALMCFGLFVIYSAGGEDLALMERQLFRMGLSLFIMFVVAQINPEVLRRWAFPIYITGVILLLGVHFFGEINKGAQRWLNLGFMEFQPSELMKLAFPITMAWYISKFPLPPKKRYLAGAGVILLIPTLLIAKQPDLGTSILVAASGIFVLFLSGMSWRIVGGFIGSVLAMLPILWFFLMHDYQRTRVLTLLDPEKDPLGAGYHIIQSKIAIGSGGMLGKGWLDGTQSQLEFLPERHTDFIFAVIGEEFGLMGSFLLLAIYLYIIGRGLVIASQAQTSFARLLAGSITLTFFVYIFVNIGMVSGLLPVVGVPLPLISYGGTSMLTLMTGFGILMSIHTHRRFVDR
ncbi:rod shape-determining protein RodA [Shewanella sp. D64]|uniref:rod shape-determining protein RodA n=1 Tax=unclassified Shewanella TaxID=196818 RepID=UPI0022BA3406|nr:MULTISPECIES: rod shape-determining protein RodA [unclassified Shewanella]MEC4728717.1 rod shape-determining protein RodA [Shewanella sp. D64]MEC4740341.1 rod shape-determining protein RodA [Shewanella sp. E94]WBJ94318.1 rod shape-determining protein RodA [Shewanella sp. MTB7]